MRKVQLILFLIILTINIPNLIIGQENKEISPYALEAQSFSPQVAGMQRFDILNNPLNKGLVDLNIPLISYRDKDFDFPISIKYDSQGFKPNVPSNFVGLNWILSCGGVIHREVMGIPDDSYIEYNDPGSPIQYRIKGFRHMIDLAKNPSFISIDKNNLLKEPDKYIEHQLGSEKAVLINKDSVEASSDIYHFSFGNHSGKFVIGLDGNVNVVAYNGGKYKVDLSGFSYSYPLMGENSSKIKIITDDGYIYTFGGSYAAMEYMALSWLLNPGDLLNTAPNYSRRNQVTAFHLSKITAPNGKELVITYMNPIQRTDFHKYPNELLHSNWYNHLIQNKYNYTYTFIASPLQTFTEILLGSNEDPLRGSLPLLKQYTLTKTALIRSISTDLANIEFYYSAQEENIFNSRDENAFAAACGTRLDSLVFFSKDHSSRRNRVNNVSMNYMYDGNRMLLSSVYNSQIGGTYQFKYNSGEIVDPFTIDIDHWGYWVGNNINQSLLPDVDYARTTVERQNVEYRGANRIPTGEKYDAFLLSEIQYPTGGKTRYTYEPHYFSHYLDQKDLSSFNLKLFSAKKQETNIDRGELAGGARIRRIEHIDTKSSNPNQIITYQYTDKKDSFLSSGILLKRKPLYGHTRIEAIYQPNLSTEKTSIFSLYPVASLRSDGWQTTADYGTNYIEYSKIFEYYNKGEDRKWGSSLSINPLDDVRERKTVLEFKNEENDSYSYRVKNILKIQGTGSIAQPSLIKLYISGSKKSERREYKFTTSSIGDLYKQQIINILDEFGEGEIDIQMKASPGYFLKIETEMEDYSLVSGEYKEYTYTNFQQNNDIEYRNPFLSKNSAQRLRNKPDSIFALYFGKKVLDHSQERGLLKQVKSYNKDGKLVQGILNEYTRYNYENFEVSIFNHPDGTLSKQYNTIPMFGILKTEKQDKYLSDIRNCWQNPDCLIPEMHYHYRGRVKPYEIDYPIWYKTVLQIFKIPLYSYLPIKEIITDYTNGGQITQTTEYDYDKNGYLKRKTFGQLQNNNQQQLQSEYYQYAFEESIEPYKKMKELNILSPITKVSTINNNKSAGDKEVSVIKRNYELIENIMKNKEIAIIKSVESGINNSSLEKRVEHLKFDLYGNPVYMIKDGAIHSVYIWSYKGQHPVAIIEGATYNDVLKALDNKTPESFSAEDIPNMSVLNNLRSKLPHAHIYTYVYKPFIGVSTTINPQGITTYYEYDKGNRLKEIYTIDINGKKEILKHYQYSFK